ncbi:hypothetical protein EcE22_5322 [Escherichia coli E22]|nr:hypothetical protein EcE22_5322 [Escherichia coli E22]
MKDKATKIKSINKKIIWRLSVFAFIVFYFISLCGEILHLFHALTLLYRILLFFLENNNAFNMWMFLYSKIN